MEQAFEIDTVERDGATVLIIAGEVDLATAPMLDEKIVTAAASGAETVIIDLDRVTFMDSSGLQVLIAHTLAQGDGARLYVTRGSPQVRRLFEVSGLLEHLPFAADQT